MLNAIAASTLAAGTRSNFSISLLQNNVYNFLGHLLCRYGNERRNVVLQVHFALVCRCPCREEVIGFLLQGAVRLKENQLSFQESWKRCVPRSLELLLPAVKKDVRIANWWKIKVREMSDLVCQFSDSVDLFHRMQFHILVVTVSEGMEVH